jgi:hypothetical protein
MANKFKRLFPELTQGVDVPIEEQKYDAPREIAGPAKPIEAVVPRFLTDTVTGVPGMLAGVLRAAADYYPEKLGKTTKTKTEEAALPEWLLTAITDPNFRNTEAGQKAIKYARDNVWRKEKLQRNLSLREEKELMDNSAKFITHNKDLPSEIPLADEGAKLVKDPYSNAHDQAWSLEHPQGKVENWVNIQKDFEGVPSVGFLKGLPENLKGNALAAQAYTQLAKNYGTLRSDPTGATSDQIKRSFWNHFGQPFEHNFGGPYGVEQRYEFPFKVNAREQNKKILERYKNLSEQSKDEVELLNHIIRPDIRYRSKHQDDIQNVEGIIDHMRNQQNRRNQDFPRPLSDSEKFLLDDPRSPMSREEAIKAIKIKIEQERLTDQEGRNAFAREYGGGEE